MENTHAGFWVRLLACLIDSLIIGVTLGLTFTIIVFNNVIEQATLDNLIDLSTLIVCTLYSSITLSSPWQATIGKKLLGLRLVNQDGTRVSFLKALGRSTIGYFISTILLCIGFIAIGVTKRKTGIHDTLFKTYVIYA